MILLGAGFVVMTRGMIGAVAGVVCIVVAIVWKIWATRTAERILSSRKAAQAETEAREDPEL